MSQFDPEAGPHPVFFVDAGGPFGPGQVRIVWHETIRPRHPAVESLLSVWPDQVEEVRRRGGVLFNGPMVRCTSHHLEQGSLIIEAEPTDFATFLCTNYLNHSRGQEIGWEHFGNPLGISANVFTTDGWIVYGRRAARVACHPGTVHAFGGGLEPKDRNGKGELDPFVSMDRELREELRLSEEVPIELTCLGLIRDAQIRQPELVFDARLPLTRHEVAERIGPDDEEHESTVALRDEPSAIDQFLRDTRQSVPILVGALWLHAVRVFADAFDRGMPS